MGPKNNSSNLFLRRCNPDSAYWCIYMTGTLSQDDIKIAKKKFCMSPDIVTISASPILPSHYFLNIQRSTVLFFEQNSKPSTPYFLIFNCRGVYYVYFKLLYLQNSSRPTGPLDGPTNRALCKN